MRTFVLLFVISAAFGITIGAVYWFVAHEETTGTVLLGMMTAALSFAAAYAIVAERRAGLAGDRPDPVRDSATGEDLGVFTRRSPWPFVIAWCALGALTGVLWSPFLATCSLLVLGFALWRLGSESADV